MVEIGKFQNLEILKLVDFGAYLIAGELEILIPLKYLPENSQPGDILNVFIYKDSEDRIIATTLTPYGLVGEFVPLKAKQVSQFGAFMEWGLEKDLLVPNNEQKQRINEGETHVVKITLDPRTERLIGTTKLNAFFSNDLSALHINKKVDLLVYKITEIGAMVVIDQAYNGMIYKTDIFENLEVGDRKTGYIHNIRDDGKIDVKFGGFDAVDTYKSEIMEQLKIHQFLPYHDNSAPEEIQKNLNMSKKSFKKAIGGLFKDGLIKIENNGIRLLTDAD